MCTSTTYKFLIREDKNDQSYNFTSSDNNNRSIVAMPYNVTVSYNKA